MKPVLFAVFFVCLPLLCVDAHHPQGVTYKVFQFAPDAIPKIDGDPSDWNEVPPTYKIDGSHLMDTVMGNGKNMDPEDLAVEVTVGWSPATNRLYFLYKVHDDMHNFNFERGDIFEVVVDADHSGGRYHTFEDVDAEIEARLKSTTCQNYHIFTPPAAGKAWAWVWGSQQWLIEAPWAEHAFRYDFGFREAGTLLLEFSITPFNYASHRGPHFSAVHKLIEGEILGLSWSVLDYDENDKEYEGFWNLSHHTRMDSTASLLPNFKLMPLEGAMASAVAGGKIELRPYVWEGPYTEMRYKNATPHDDGLCVDLRAPWMEPGERLILRTSEIVGFETGYFYDDHFPHIVLQGRGEDYRHIPFHFKTEKAPEFLAAECVAPGRGRFRLDLTAHEDSVDILLSIRNDSPDEMDYVDWYFCPVAFEAATIGDPKLERTYFFDGERLRTIAELSGVGKGEEMYAVTGERGSGGWIPPLHARHTRNPVEAKAPIVLVENVSGTHTVALGFEKAHSIFSSPGNRCFHADPYFGRNLKPGEERSVRGRLYLMKGTAQETLKRFQNEFGG